MSGLSGFGDKPGMRRMPRPAGWGSCPDLVSVPRLPERRSRAGSGDGRSCPCVGPGRGVERFVPCKATVRAVSGRTYPALSSSAPRPAARAFPAPPQGATCGVQPHRIAGAPKRHSRRPAGGIPGAPSRGASEAAASSRQALRVRRESVVTTVELARLGSDDALRRRTDNPETRVVRGVSHSGSQRKKSAGKCQRAETRFFHPPAKKVWPPVSAPCSQDRTGTHSGKEPYTKAL